MQYSVPQFIDVENKIVGPISVRQFILIAIGVAFTFMAFKLADLPLFILLTVIIVILTGTFAFVKVNGRPFHYFMLNLFVTLRDPHLKVWKKEIQTVKAKKAKEASAKGAEVNYIKIAREKEKAHSHLSDLSLLVDTGGYYGMETN